MNKLYYIGGVALVGIALLIGGLTMSALGLENRGIVVKSLIEEDLQVQDPQILLSYEGASAPEGVDVPIVLVDTAHEAHNQALVIRTHTLASTAGLTYSEMTREDPNRDFYLKSLTLQTSLHQAHMSIEVTNLVIGVGVAFAGLGVAVLALALPITRKIVS